LIDHLALDRGHSCLLKFILCFSRSHTEIIDNFGLITGADINGERLALHDSGKAVPLGLDGYGQTGGFGAAYTAPGRGHCVGSAVLVITADNPDRGGLGQYLGTERCFHEALLADR
jgi:hypothetical protein